MILLPDLEFYEYKFSLQNPFTINNYLIISVEEKTLHGFDSGFETVSAIEFKYYDENIIMKSLFVSKNDFEEKLKNVIERCRRLGILWNDDIYSSRQFPYENNESYFNELKFQCRHHMRVRYDSYDYIDNIFNVNVPRYNYDLDRLVAQGRINSHERFIRRIPYSNRNQTVPETVENVNLDNRVEQLNEQLEYRGQRSTLAIIDDSIDASEITVENSVDSVDNIDNLESTNSSNSDEALNNARAYTDLEESGNIVGTIPAIESSATVTMSEENYERLIRTMQEGLPNSIGYVSNSTSSLDSQVSATATISSDAVNRNMSSTSRQLLSQHPYYSEVVNRLRYHDIYNNYNVGNSPDTIIRFDYDSIRPLENVIQPVKVIHKYNYKPEYIKHYMPNEDTSSLLLGVEIEVDCGGESEEHAKKVLDIIHEKDVVCEKKEITSILLQKYLKAGETFDLTNKKLKHVYQVGKYDNQMNREFTEGEYLGLDNFYITNNILKAPLNREFNYIVFYEEEKTYIKHNICEEKMYCTHDGSLKNGIEFDSMPCTLEYHKKQMNYEEMFKYLSEHGYKAHDTTTCGLHVHANRSYLGNSELIQQLTISKILYILEKFNEKICVIARRGNSFSRFVGQGRNEKSVVELYGKYKNQDKHVALNLKHKDTIEFRCFKGTLKYETFILTLEFVKNIIDYAKSINIEDIEKIQWNDLMNTFSEELKNYYNKRLSKQVDKRNNEEKKLPTGTTLAEDFNRRYHRSTDLLQGELQRRRERFNENGLIRPITESEVNDMFVREYQNTGYTNSQNQHTQVSHGTSSLTEYDVSYDICSEFTRNLLPLSGRQNEENVLKKKIKSLKKRIKYCRCHMEKVKLQQELNQLQKELKKKRKTSNV